MASQNCTIQELLDMIKSLQKKVDKLELSSKKGGIDILWTGSHWMDGGSNLVINDHDFDNYSMIVISCNTENNDSDPSFIRNGLIYCTTAQYGSRSCTWLDLTGDDWAGAYLVDNHTIKPGAGAGVWIRAVYGIK